MSTNKKNNKTGGVSVGACVFCTDPNGKFIPIDGKVITCGKDARDKAQKSRDNI